MKTSLFVLMLCVLLLPLGSFAQQLTNPPGAKGAPEHGMMGQHMKEHEQMMSRMKEMDARLDSKVAAMDAAKGDQKVEAMAEVIKEMVAQRKAMREHMMEMRKMHKGKMGQKKGGME